MTGEGANSVPLLRVENLSVQFGSRGRPLEAVKSLSFHIQPGETLAIVGESGSGKSVTALSLMRLIEREGGTITGGRVNFMTRAGAPRDLLRLDEATLRGVRGRDISMIFQEPMTSLNPVFTVGEQLAEVLMLHEQASRREALERAAEMLKKVRIPDPLRRLNQYPHELSGGMRQRVMIAMAMFCRPQLLIADEPTTALDVTIQAQVLELIKLLQEESGMSVLFITHDLGVVADIADRVLVMRHGEKVEESPIRTLFAAPTQPYTKALLAAVPRLGHEQGPVAPADVAPILTVQGLTKRFPIRKGIMKRIVGHVHAVENISFHLKRGETLALVGESGCGKSTTGRAIMKLIEPDAGQITLNGKDVSAFTARQMRPVRREIQMIFQDPYASLNPRLTAFEAVVEPLVIHEPGISRAALRERAAALLARVGLPADYLSRFPHQFSGGQRQRLCIARALSVSPKIIVADEAVSALDVSVQAQVIDLLRELQARDGISYLFISHDMGVVERMSHRVAVMYLGQIVEIGDARDVLSDPRHDYTRRLLASVPVPDPEHRSKRTPIAQGEVPSPIRMLGDAPATPALTEVAPGHFVQAA